MPGTPKSQEQPVRELHELRSRVAELEYENERLRLVVQGSDDGLWDWPDINVDRQWWSPRSYELLGYEDGELEPTLGTFVGLLHPDDREEQLARVKSRPGQHEPFESEFRLRTMSGEYRWFLSRGRVFHDDQGNPVRRAGSLRDITERKRAEEALQESEEQLRLVTDALPILISYVDSEQRYQFNNRGYEQWFGHPRHEVKGKHLTPIFAEGFGVNRI